MIDNNISKFLINKDYNPEELIEYVVKKQDEYKNAKTAYQKDRIFYDFINDNNINRLRCKLENSYVKKYSYLENDIIKSNCFDALLIAFENFDKSKNVTFSTFLYNSTKYIFGRFFVNKDPLGTVQNVAQINRKINSYSNNYKKEFGEFPSDQNIMNNFKLRPNELALIRGEKASLEGSVNSEENGSILADFIADDKPLIEDVLIENQRRATLNVALENAIMASVNTSKQDAKFMKLSEVFAQNAEAYDIICKNPKLIKSFIDKDFGYDDFKSFYNTKKHIDKRNMILATQRLKNLLLNEKRSNNTVERSKQGFFSEKAKQIVDNQRKLSKIFENYNEDYRVTLFKIYEGINNVFGHPLNIKNLSDLTGVSRQLVDFNNKKIIRRIKRNSNLKDTYKNY